MDIQTAKQIFDAHNGIMKKCEIEENKIYPNYLYNLIRKGYVERVRYGYYQWQDERAFSEVAMLASLFPNAVLCRYSALQYYGYIDRTPNAWYLAVNRGYTKTKFKMEYPVIRPVFYSQEQMKMGVETVTIENIVMKIFNREHIICDCLRQENKMDVEIFNKAIQAYVRDMNKNIPRLMEYAKLLHTENKMRRMIGVWL